MRLGVDAMGGDLAPAEPVKGVLAARNQLGDNDKVVLIGDEAAIRAQLKDAGDWQSFIEIHHAGQVVGMNEHPVEALRNKPDSSLARMAEMHAAGELDAIISAGNTGACVAACQMRLRRLRGVHRPGIAVICPTFYGPVAMCDVGANVSCRPQHLHQYAIMASEYMRAICHLENARVGLLSIGEEDAKGNELVKQTRELLRQDPAINFIGNAEGRDVFRGTCDVMICEGFVGNVCLKLIEGLAEGLFKSMYKEMTTQKPQLMGEFEGVLKIIRNKWDFNEYGGAPLLGINGICIILHGASHYRAFVNGLRVARESAAARINDRIIDRIRQHQGLVHD